MNQGLETIEYVNRTKAKWPVLPETMSIIEYCGDGDPFFGGNAKDCPLGKKGEILTSFYHSSDVAEFSTIEEAHEAAKKIPNRRPNSILGVAPTWKRGE